MTDIRRPSPLGCAAVSWFNGISLSIRVFYVSTSGQLVMRTFDDPSFNEKNKDPISWNFSSPKIDDQVINGISISKGDAITAVSVHPNTPNHEIHIFYVSSWQSIPRILQSVILDVNSGKWFRDTEILKLNTGDCPSAAIGWEVGLKNSFRLYCGRQKSTEFGMTNNEVIEICHDGDGPASWYIGNNNQSISPEIKETNDDNGQDYTTRVAACTWLDAANTRQFRVYTNSTSPPGSIVELVYVKGQGWKTGGPYASGYFGSRGCPSAAIALVNNGNFEGIRQYAYKGFDDGSVGWTAGPVTWNELAWDQNANKWSDQRLPFNLKNLTSEPGGRGFEKAEAKIPFGVVSWRWSDGSGNTSIRLYRVTALNGDVSQQRIEETGFDTSGGWTNGSQYL